MGTFVLVSPKVIQNVNGKHKKPLPFTKIRNRPLKVIPEVNVRKNYFAYSFKYVIYREIYDAPRRWQDDDDDDNNFFICTHMYIYCLYMRAYVRAGSSSSSSLVNNIPWPQLVEIFFLNCILAYVACAATQFRRIRCTYTI